MVIALNERDIAALDVTVGRILEVHAAKQASTTHAQRALSHIVNSAAKGDECELRGWLLPETVALWELGF